MKAGQRRRRAGATVLEEKGAWGSEEAPGACLQQTFYFLSTARPRPRQPLLLGPGVPPSESPGPGLSGLPVRRLRGPQESRGMTLVSLRCSQARGRMSVGRRIRPSLRAGWQVELPWPVLWRGRVEGAPRARAGGRWRARRTGPRWAPACRRGKEGKGRGAASAAGVGGGGGGRGGRQQQQGELHAVTTCLIEAGGASRSPGSARTLRRAALMQSAASEIRLARNSPGTERGLERENERAAPCRPRPAGGGSGEGGGCWRLAAGPGEVPKAHLPQVSTGCSQGPGRLWTVKSAHSPGWWTERGGRRERLAALGGPW